MSVIDLLTELREKDIQLRVDGNKLRVDAPDGTLTSDLIEALKQSKSEVIEFLNESTRSRCSAGDVPIRPVSREQNLPLSWAQQRLWFLNQLEPDSPAYNIPSFIRLRGKLDVAAFERCLNEIVKRHEALRTTYVFVNGEPTQIVSPSANISVSVMDLEGLSEREREEKVHSIVAEESRYLFDLQKGPLLRATLLRAGAADHYLIFVVHHIAFDGWSAGVFVREMGVLYSAFTAGKPSPLPEVQIQYADFAYWQRQRPENESTHNQLAYWKTKLAGQLPKLQLPSDFLHDTEQKYTGGHTSIKISATVSEEFKSLCHKENATLFMGLLAVFTILLHRHSAMEDIVVGCPIANRNRTDVEGLIGCFLNTLALRIDLSGDPSFRELLTRVREVALGAFANQDIPFERLLEEIRPEREIHRTPIFQVMFVLQNMPMVPIDLSGLTIIPMDIDTGTTKFDLNMHGVEGQDGILTALQFNADLFDSSTIEQMLGSYLALVESIVLDPDRKITDYPLLTPAQRQQLRSHHNLIRPTNPFTVFRNEEIEQSIASRFEDIVERFPGKVAVKSRTRELTYEGLNQKANAVANAILKTCEGESERIALLFEHNVDMIAALLAVLKAGKTYVPLDPAYPVERLSYMIKDSQASFLLSNKLNLTLAKELKTDGIELINIDDIDEKLDRHNPNIVISPDTPAYILYTSGSTGKPKGVVQNHRNVLHFTRVYTNGIHISHDDRLTLISTYSFDAAVMDIFGALLNGAALYPVNIKEEGLTDLPSWLVDQKISIYHSTPTVYRFLMDTLSGNEEFPDLRMVVLGGEAVYKRDVDLYKKYFAPDCLFVNGLGPTESTVSIQYFINKESETSRHRVPVGYPVEDTEIFLINSAGRLDDIYGEIGIKSQYVTLGYWNKPDLTKEAFLPDPSRGDGRIYRTGDMGRYLPDGSIEFLGRKDSQIKIRGHRIEVGEIETALNEHPAIENCAAFKKTINDRDYVIACVVPNNSEVPSMAELRLFLQERLPDYMIPSAFVFRDSLPLTPTSKIDRRSLEYLDLDFGALGGEQHAAPRTITEHSLVEIWSRVLGAAQIGVLDNFFQLGGHSLLAAQVVSRIREALHVDLPLRSLFENPTVADLAAYVDRMEGKVEELRLPLVVPIARDQSLPLSFSQERLWFLSQLEPESTAYSMPGSVRLKGKLDRKALEQTLMELVRRHETLRTTFRSIDGRPEQMIATEPEVSLVYQDLRGIPEVTRETELLRLADERSREPFDLVSGPLFRISLFQLDDDDHMMHANMHHIISDYWSFGVMSREFIELYKAFATGGPLHLPELPVQYADFAYCQRQWLQGKVLATHLAYWKEKLGGELTTLDLPTDRPRPAVQTHSGAIESLILPQDLAKELKNLSHREGATLFMLLLAAFKALLFRYTGQEDIVVGAPIAGRNRVELEGLIGFFMNTVVMRTYLSGNPSFQVLLGRVRETALGAYAHQEMPFEKLVEELAPKRDLSRTPLFQIFFNHIRINESRVDLPGLEVEVGGGIEREAKFDVTLYIWEQADAICLTALYNADLFDAERITQMLRQYETLLKQVADNPEEKIANYSLVTPESRQILPDPRVLLAEPRQMLVTEMFSSWVKRVPERPAVTSGDRTLTYRELSERAHILAETLQLHGVEQGDVVAVYGPRSFGLIVSMMAVFLNGNVLLPIDDNLPTQRQQLIIREAGARFLLHVGNKGSEERLGQDPTQELRFISVTTEGQAETPTDSALEAISLPQLSIDDAAYIIFTSGTTGVPKGVLGSHKGLSHFLTWQRETFDITPEDRVAQFTSLSFDPVLREIFLPLTSGATLCLPEGVDLINSNDVLSWLERERISVLHTVPTLAQSWLTTTTVELPLGAIRLVFFAGEPLTENLVQKWRSVFPGSEIVNLYGPTETTLAKCFYRVKSDDIHHGVQPLGKPLPQSQALVLSRENQLCGIGEPGEIVLRTPFRSLGYVNNEEENWKRFVKNPFRDDEADLVYFTGDRGCYRPDGILEFLGRLDDQVKIRGVRVEPNEIAAILAKHPTVDSCFVTNWQDEQGRAYLAAYAVVKQNGVTVSELTTYLKQLLPATMVPEAFVFLDALPVTSRGKIDRRALPLPDRSRPDLEEAFVAPRTQSEELVTGIWSDVLGRERIGVRDNFFELGGHSLLVMQVISRIREAFQVELPLRALFEAPTVAGLTERIDVARRSEQCLQAPPFRVVRRDEELTLSFAQQRLWFLHHLEPDSVAYSMPYAVRFKGILNVDALKQTFIEIARRHESLRTQFRSIGGRPVPSISNDPNILFDTIDLRHLSEAERESEARRLADEDTRKPFDLAHGPLLRVLLFQLGAEEHMMHLNMHHIVSDFWSLGIITRELAALYGSFVKGETAHLPELPIQYADFAHWQRQWLQGDVLNEQLRYWKEKLGGELPVSQLPTDHPRPAIQTYRGARQSLVLPKSLTDTVGTMSRREGVTLFMTLLAAFKTLLYRLTGQEDILVGTPISGRNRVELEGLIGVFVSTIVMRTDLSGAPAFRELLARVRETALGAYTHQEMPFEKLVEELAPKRDLSRTPLFQVFFNYIVVDSYNVELPGLEAEVLGRLERESKFDLTLYIGERDGEIALTALYNASLFSQERMICFLEQYRDLLEQIVADIGKPIRSYSLVTPESRQILPDPRVLLAEPRQMLVTEMFSSWVKRVPERPAVTSGDRTLTYRELSERAHILAETLQLHGVEQGDVVAVYGPRSFGLIVSMMAVFLNGNVLLPIDDNLPTQRQQLIIREAGARFLLHVGNKGSEERLGQDPTQELRFISVTTEGQAETPTDSALEAISLPQLSIDDAAYIIFTSGTTGVPKGVLGSHKGLSHFLTWQRETFDITPEDRVAQFTSLSFDPVLREIFLPLTSGATLCLPEGVDLINSNDVLSWLERERISVLHTVPTLAQSWLTTTTVELPLGAIRLVFFAGEPLTENLVQKWRSVFPGSEIVNLYGPTETTLAKCFYRVKSDDIHHGVQPLGKPLPQSQALVLSRENQLCGIGEPGEIVLRTPFRSLGYVNNEEENWKRFVKNPFRDDEADLVYFTGDRGCYRPDGILEFLGRLDDQVKIRGVRVEPNEIAAILAKHPTVDSCFVTNWQDEQGRAYLAAYAVVKQNGVTVSELTTYLKQLLPATMVPEAFVFLDALPVTSRGKIDRRALPLPDRSRPDLEEAFVAPRTQSEELVTGIWSDVLGRERIGVRDNFFELGGHSLLVMQVISRIREAFQVELPLRALFEAPTVAGLTERIDVARRSEQCLQAPPFRVVRRDEELTLSFAQQRLWFLHHLEPDSVAYSMPYAVRFKGILNVDALKQTFIEIARRHESLRTQFRSIGGRPVPSISNDPNILFDTIDLRHLSEAERESEARRLADEDTRKPFDLAHGPLLRVLLFQLGAEEHMMHLNMHHIVSDFWSLGIITRELAALYGSFVKGETAHLPELPIQYADFAHWQRQWLQGDVLNEQLRYWKEKLGGELPVSQLPTDHPRPAIQTYRGARQSLVLPKSLTDTVGTMSRREGVTLFMTLLAAFKTLLYRLTGQEDILVGTPISGRNRVELEGLIGVFVSTIVMRTDLSGAPAFRELLARVRETALGAYTHQEMPFEKLVEELAPKRDLSRTPLFQVFFNYIVVDSYNVELPGLEAEVLGRLERESKFDLTLYIGERDGEIALTALYNSDLFDADRMATMLDQYQGLLKQIVDNPEERIAYYSLLTPSQRKDLPDPRVPLIPRWEGTVHERFSEQARRVPEHVVIVDPWGSWSYGELDRYSNQLAAYLRTKGVQPGDIVAICGHRSTGLVLSLLGALKAGAAFVILDSRYPVSRVVKMLEEASPRGWLQMEAAGPCADEVQAWLDASQLTCRLTIPRTKKATEYFLEGMSPEPPEDGVRPDDTAYITFTSGTTGRPKGIVGTHRPLAHFLEWHCKEFDLKGSDRFSMLSGLSHDPLLRDIFTPLWLGATLCIPDPDDILIPDKLRAWMRTQHITVAHITPALGRLLSHAAEAKAGYEELPTLRYVFFGGDTLTQRHVDKIRGIAPSVMCINYYGATETPQAMGYHVVDAQQQNELRDRVPVGKGIEGVQLLVLNPVGQVAGIGELGEIHIRTPYLARCYLNDEALTGDRFIPNPFVDLSGDRLYRTGDLGRYLPDGQVMFHGRSDGQVSIRGFRVELKEIETILTTHPDIRDCVVIAREREPDDRYLAAYVVGKDARTLDPVNLRQYVGKHLPEYMIPSAMIALEGLPLTLNGKIDTAKLIRLEPPNPDTFSDEPLTQMEAILIDIWKEALGFDSITVHNNFFEIGGHSLLSIQVIAQLEKKIGLKVNPREFVYQTLGQLAASIERQRKGLTPGGGESKRKSIWRIIKQKIQKKTRKLAAPKTPPSPRTLKRTRAETNGGELG